MQNSDKPFPCTHNYSEQDHPFVKNTAQVDVLLLRGIIKIPICNDFNWQSYFRVWFNDRVQNITLLANQI